MKIRLLNEQDITAWKKLRLLALKDSPESFGSSYEEEAIYSDDDWRSSLNKSQIFGAFIDTALVGSAGFFALNTPKTRHRGVLFTVYTEPDYRKQGVARASIQAVVDHAKSNVEQLHVTCVTSNLSALKMYKEFGFSIYGTEPSALKIGNNFFDEHLMVLNLEGNKNNE
ncbi:MAG: GNAT family N-acetyltransferase [Proteobacteria bacterium]|nr:GNAT family N-acetyltransferase [Pseudomonadota bacterium]